MAAVSSQAMWRASSSPSSSHTLPYSTLLYSVINIIVSNIDIDIDIDALNTPDPNHFFSDPIFSVPSYSSAQQHSSQQLHEQEHLLFLPIHRHMRVVYVLLSNFQPVTWD